MPIELGIEGDEHLTEPPSGVTPNDRESRARSFLSSRAGRVVDPIAIVRRSIRDSSRDSRLIGPAIPLGTARDEPFQQSATGFIDGAALDQNIGHPPVSRARPGLESGQEPCLIDQPTRKRKGTEQMFPCFVAAAGHA
jgi:hypothetical protein